MGNTHFFELFPCFALFLVAFLYLLWTYRNHVIVKSIRNQDELLEQLRRLENSMNETVEIANYVCLAIHVHNWGESAHRPFLNPVLLENFGALFIGEGLLVVVVVSSYYPQVLFGAAWVGIALLQKIVQNGEFLLHQIALAVVLHFKGMVPVQDGPALEVTLKLLDPFNHYATHGWIFYFKVAVLDFRRPKGPNIWGNFLPDLKVSVLFDLFSILLLHFPFMVSTFCGKRISPRHQHLLVLVDYLYVLGVFWLEFIHFKHSFLGLQ